MQLYDQHVRLMYVPNSDIVFLHCAFIYQTLQWIITKLKYTIYSHCYQKKQQIL
jgi:hypothetical protein